MASCRIDGWDWLIPPPLAWRHRGVESRRPGQKPGFLLSGLRCQLKPCACLASAAGQPLRIRTGRLAPSFSSVGRGSVAKPSTLNSPCNWQIPVTAGVFGVWPGQHWGMLALKGKVSRFHVLSLKFHGGFTAVKIRVRISPSCVAALGKATG